MRALRPAHALCRASAAALVGSGGKQGAGGAVPLQAAAGGRQHTVHGRRAVSCSCTAEAWARHAATLLRRCCKAATMLLQHAPPAGTLWCCRWPARRGSAACGGPSTVPPRRHTWRKRGRAGPAACGGGMGSGGSRAASKSVPAARLPPPSIRSNRGGRKTEPTEPRHAGAACHRPRRLPVPPPPQGKLIHFLKRARECRRRWGCAHPTREPCRRLLCITHRCSRHAGNAAMSQAHEVMAPSQATSGCKLVGSHSEDAAAEAAAAATCMSLRPPGRASTAGLTYQ